MNVSRLICAVGLLCLALSPLQASDFVVISSTKSADYDRTIPGRSGVRPESYTFSPGKHLGSATRDASEEKTSFMTIASTLAPGLAKQSYFPATVPTDADLLIVVHWGSTAIYEDPDKQMTIEGVTNALGDVSSAISANGWADTGGLNQALAAQEGHTMNQNQQMDFNAAILGYKRSLDRESNTTIPREEEKTMRAELSEERYFVVLMAYDYPYMKKNKKPRLLWVTHMSIRSPGNNFKTALPEMTNVAASYYGRSIDGLAHEETNVRAGRVEIGEAKVVPSATEAPPEKKK